MQGALCCALSDRLLSFQTRRQEPRALGTLSFGSGTAICGVGLLGNGLLCAAGRLASGNVQVQAWELLGDSRELQVLPTVAPTGTLWDALQSMVGKAALADVSGENVVTRLHFHAPTGAIAVATALRGHEAEAGHQRVPLLHLLDGADVVGALVRSPIHSGLSFWSARENDAVVSKLRFPRYVHVVRWARAQCRQGAWAHTCAALLSSPLSRCPRALPTAALAVSAPTT